MRSFSLWLMAVLSPLVLALSCAQPHPSPVVKSVPPPKPVVVPTPKSPGEIRAVWISDTPKLDWDTATRDLQHAGFNTMYVNLASGGAAMYPDSKILPSLVDGNPDPIARGIELAHRRGLAVHAKQIVMFTFKSPPDFQKMLFKTDRVMHGADGKPITQSGVYWLCPSQPANHDTVVAAVGEMLSKYPVDGLQYDYMRFNEEPSCYCKHCREEFEKFSGARVRHWPADVISGDSSTRFNEWRESVINGWVRDLSARARQVRPGLKISAAVFPVLERAREEKAQDWRYWVEKGYVDTVCPMNYTTDLHDFDQRSRGVLSQVPRDHVVMGVAGWKFTQMDDEIRQIELTRKLGTAGFALFSYDDAATRNFLPLFVAR